jgi:hypothetical protein
MITVNGKFGAKIELPSFDKDGHAPINTAISGLHPSQPSEHKS